MKKCESCGAPPPRITEGEFAGQRGMHDYCEHCSADLCEGCMKTNPCSNAPDGKHKPYVEEDDIA